MILRIRNSRTFKGICVTLVLSIFFQIIAPNQALALTGGPSQPEFDSFTPLGTSDMVDLSSGDMNYNIPLMDVGGYPINLAYSSNVGMDQEASFVGLGWNISVGQINRNVRGIPDDFKGDDMIYENHVKKNVTVGVNFKFTPYILGIDTEGNPVLDSNGDSTYAPGNVTVGLSAMYNNYTGFTLKPSVGIQMDLAKNVSVGFSAESGPDGLTVSPNLSLHTADKFEKKRNSELGLNIGTSLNSRRGLSHLTIDASREKQRYMKSKKKVVKGTQALGSSISFADQLYTPSKRVAMTTETFTVNAALGAELFGGEGQGQVTAYGTKTKVAEGDRYKELSAFGYNNTYASGNTGVQDFNREKDGAFSVNTTNLPLTNYTYDIYSVQGQGVSGMYRPYQNQVGYVHDAYVSDGSTSLTIGVEFGTGNSVHGGIDFEATLVNSHSGNWTESNGNYMLNYLDNENANFSPAYEPVHYKNVGDLSADYDLDAMFGAVGSYNPARIPYNENGAKFDRKALNRFKVKANGLGGETEMYVGNQIHRTQRLNRNQSIRHVTYAELSNGIGYGPCTNRNGSGAEITPITQAQSHHTGEIQVTRNDGARYIYGLAVYNTKKVEATFSVKEENAICSNGLVSYEQSSINSPNTLPNDKYLERITTPGYAHSYLLTSVLSADYQDRTNDGPTTDDFGSYTNFSYVQKDAQYKWRIPYDEDKASYNEGLKTDKNDDRGNYVYGEKELYYVQKIETKTHVAIFEYSPRKDAKGVDGESGGLGTSESSYKLDKISLYSAEEWDEQIPSSSTPIKVVHFEYSYSLCPGVPNNQTGTLDSNEKSNFGGKLTLKKVYFTYRNSKMGKYTPYHFNYNEFVNGDDEYSNSNLTATDLNDEDGGGSKENPRYHIKGYDSWGNYLPNGSSDCYNTDPLTATEFPFTPQNQTTQNTNSSVWLLKKIDLPSGGNIQVNYESDDYAYVQDKETMRMFKVVGAGDDRDGTSHLTTFSSYDSDELFGGQLLNKANTYLYVQIDNGATSGDIDKYLAELRDSPIYFRFLMNMTKVGGQANNEDEGKFDYVTGYFEYEEVHDAVDDDRYNGAEKIFSFNYDGISGDESFLSIPVKLVEKEGGFFGAVNATNEVHPISKAAWQFGRRYLNNHVYSNQPNGDSEDIEAVVADLLTPEVLNNLIEIFNGPNATLENSSIGRRFIKDKSWVRLGNPQESKLGGGARVSQVTMSDVWEDMTGGVSSSYETMTYGQKYEYTLADNTKSSGVATYEPVGNKENPFVQPIFSTEEHLLAPDDQNFIEGPFGESFFPSPQVTYSMVKVTSLQFGDQPIAGWQVIKRHKTGHVINEFYTSKDYPTITDQTVLKAEEDKKELLDNILKLNVRKHLTASQGYTIHLNDMNGKQKAQWVYAEGQNTPISGVRYLYENYETPSTFSGSSSPGMTKGKLNNEVVVIRPDGSVGRETIGVEVDVINDFRENATISEIPGINANLATFFVGILFAAPVPLPDYSRSEDKFRSVSTTKVINTFGILKETIAYDAGAAVSTRNLAWDAATGEVLLTETVDEYSDKYYTLNYPAHWYYKGMAQASMNLGFTSGVTEVGSSSGIYTLNLPTGYFSSSFLIPGDELFFENSDDFGWVKAVNGNQFIVIDEAGALLTGKTGTISVIRSGHRNLQSAGIMNVTLMRNPLIEESTGNLISSLTNSPVDPFLVAQSGNWEDWRIINAGAVDYSDNWEPPCECNIDLSGTYNPFVMNERGVWRTKSSRTYLTGRNHQTEVTPRQQGFFNQFAPMYKLSIGGNWMKDFTDWTYVAEVTTYSPYGFEVENKDAIDRYSAAQYGYCNTFPMAVGANLKYAEIGFDGFEDYGFSCCGTDRHFGYYAGYSGDITTSTSHSGKYSLNVGATSRATMTKQIDCTE